MSGIKKLAGQTLWYGAPRIVSRFLNFGVSLLGFQLYDPNGTYAYTQIYAVIPFLNILFTYGLETSFFRFAQTKDRQQLYNTLNISILVSTILFAVLLFLFKEPFTHFIELDKHPEYVTWMIGILFFDTLTTLPMAKLRLEERPKKYAFINTFSVVLNILLVLFFFFVAKPAFEKDPDSFLGGLSIQKSGSGILFWQTFGRARSPYYFFIRNLLLSGLFLIRNYGGK